MRTLVLTVASVCALAAPLRAQGGGAVVGAVAGAGDSARVAPVPVLEGHDLVYLAGATAATVAVVPFDRPITHFFRTHGQESNALHTVAHIVRVTAVPGAFIIGGGLYLGGRLGGNHQMADLGLHGTEALLIANAVGGVIKLTVGRARPYAVADSDPESVHFLRGLHRGTDYMSFPSGHAITAFAAAAAVTEETHLQWPHAEGWVAPLLYGGATLVGLSRIYDDKHWASDVVMGAAIGIFTGRRVVRWQHSHPGNKLDRWFLGASITSTGAGRVVRVVVAPVGR